MKILKILRLICISYIIFDLLFIALVTVTDGAFIMYGWDAIYAQIVYRQEQLKALDDVKLISEAQKKYFAQHQKFAESLEQLNINSKLLTQVYHVEIYHAHTRSLNNQLLELPYTEAVQISAYSSKLGLKRYVGGVFKLNAQETTSTISMICETLVRGKASFEPEYKENKVFCPKFGKMTK